MLPAVLLSHSRLDSGLGEETKKPIRLREAVGAPPLIPVRYVNVRTVDLPEFLGR